MITDDKRLSPLGFKIAMEIAKKDNSEEFAKFLSNYKNNADLIYEKYRLLHDEFQKESLAENAGKITLTAGDLTLLRVLERAAFRFMGDGVSMQDFNGTYSNFYNMLMKVSMPKTKGDGDDKE